ncbi:MULTISPECIES: DUF4352 domain-containing protein [unclassified Nocardiopsis]|uniref:DUF4352 domain-containing protein n=1 Tax=Nocardiopsis TaxID=2013 RepID=UPI00387B0BCE
MSYPNDPSGPQPPYGPTGGQPPYGPPGGQPPYGPTGGQPSYGPPGGQPPYGDPAGGPYGQQPYDPYGAGAPPQKKGMSTGAKVGIGVGAGCLGLIVIVVVIIVIIAMASGGDGGGTSSSSPTSSQTTEPGAGTEDAPVEAPADGVGMTVTNAGTVGGTLDPAETYTALDVTFVNNSNEPFSVNPFYFSFILDDGTEVVDWELFADIDQFEAGDLAPGDQVSGQVAVAGEVTVVEVHYDPYFGMEDPIVVPVQ